MNHIQNMIFRCRYKVEYPDLRNMMYLSILTMMFLSYFHIFCVNILG